MEIAPLHPSLGLRPATGDSLLGHGGHRAPPVAEPSATSLARSDSLVETGSGPSLAPAAILAIHRSFGIPLLASKTLNPFSDHQAEQTL